MRASRLLSILLILQLRGRTTAAALAEEFEVSVRTIYRDLDQISASGVPVYTERGRNGGIALPGDYRTRLTGLTLAEAQSLALAGAGSAASDLGLGPDLTQARLKLLASLPPEHGAGADRTATRFHLDPAPWYGKAEAHAFLTTLAAAVWRERRIRIEYESWKGEIARTLDPLGLVLKGGVWYLVAAVRGEPRTYRVSSIRNLETTDDPAKRLPRFDLERYWRAWVSDFEKRLLTEVARVRVSREGLRRLREVSSAAAEASATPIRRLSDGWTVAEFPIEAGDFAVRQILSLGPEIEVLSPLALREAVAAAAGKLSRLNRRARR